MLLGHALKVFSLLLRQANGNIPTSIMPHHFCLFIERKLSSAAEVSREVSQDFDSLLQVATQ